MKNKKCIVCEKHEAGIDDLCALDRTYPFYVYDRIRKLILENDKLKKQNTILNKMVKAMAYA